MLDEAYNELSAGKDKRYDSVTWLKAFPNLIISRTFSRPTGWRAACRLCLGHEQ